MTELPSPALCSPAVARNRDPIRAVLERVLPAAGTVLEIASGSGEHAVYFAAAFPHLRWQPSDRDPAALASIVAHATPARLENLAPPLELDAASPHWPVTGIAAVVAINLVHISPWRATEGLFAGAARVLEPDGIVYLYGPYSENGIHSASSNAVFDESLRARNPEWGVRDVSAVTDLARTHGFVRGERVAMPANNLSLVFRREG
jgi:SAM-dependent methyltransferase